MKRFRMVVYYEDKDTQTRVAQSVVVLGEDMRAAVEATKATIGPRALGNHLIAVEVKERDEVHNGVVYAGEPYIPINWPLVNRRRRPPAGAAAGVADAPTHAAARPSVDESADNVRESDDFLELR